MSDLKKILKEEYDKKKLNITPKLLMEMIEEVMLAEATMTRLDLLKRDNDLKLQRMIRDGEDIELKDGSFVKIKKDQSAQDYIRALVTAEEPTSNLYFNIVGSEKKIKLSQIQKTGTAFSTSGKTKGPGGNVSEMFEGNIIIALGGGTIPKGLKHISTSSFSEYQEAADKLVQNLSKEGLVTGSYFKPVDGTLTKLYSGFGVKNPTPKTDIANAAKTDRISVKKDGASFLSAEGPETISLIAIAVGFDKNKELKIDGTGPYSGLLEQLKDLLSKDKWNAPGVNRRDLGNQVLTAIYFAVRERFENLLEDIAVEAMTGNNRFEDELSRANKLLTWNLDGNGKYTDLEAWVRENAKGFKFDIRWRGKKRSGGWRIDDNKSDQFKAKMEELFNDTSNSKTSNSGLNEELALAEPLQSIDIEVVDRIPARDLTDDEVLKLMIDDAPIQAIYADEPNEIIYDIKPVALVSKSV
jgi:hypothetical protein